MCLLRLTSSHYVNRVKRKRRGVVAASKQVKWKWHLRFSYSLLCWCVISLTLCLTSAYYIIMSYTSQFFFALEIVQHEWNKKNFRHSCMTLLSILACFVVVLSCLFDCRKKKKAKKVSIGKLFIRQNAQIYVRVLLLLRVPSVVQQHTNTKNKKPNTHCDADAW